MWGNPVLGELATKGYVPLFEPVIFEKTAKRFTTVLAHWKQTASSLGAQMRKLLRLKQPMRHWRWKGCRLARIYGPLVQERIAWQHKDSQLQLIAWEGSANDSEKQWEGFFVMDQLTLEESIFCYCYLDILDIF